MVLRVVSILTVLTGLAAASDIPLDRDPQSYFVLGMRIVRVSSMAMEPPGCNVGVNCAPAFGRRGACGFFHSKNASFVVPSQVVANQVCGTESFFQVFSNLAPCTNPTCAQIAHPGASPFCTDSFVPPILADLDGDGTPSCDADCLTDLDDIARACGVTLPLPPCDSNRPVLVDAGGDCSIDDLVPGNGRCDLPAGVYGMVLVRKGGRIDFAPGTTVVCGLKTGTAARVTTAGPATILVPGRGTVKFNNSADVGGDCGNLRIVTERGLLKLGRYGDYGLDACTIAGQLQLGHGNNLLGHFVGDRVGSDISNDGRCCGPSQLPGSTTTTSSTSTSTSTLATTSTTEPATTTSTTAPGATTTSTTATTTSSTSTTVTTTTSSSTSTIVTTTSPTTTSTTTTTVPGGAFTRTPGFYKTHPAITQSILTAGGGLTVCGHAITDVDIDHGHSAIEALCVQVQGNQRLQLLRHLVTAALTMAAGGANDAGFAACDAVCQNAAATSMQLASCIDQTDAFNNSGDNVVAPWDPPGSADDRPCQHAFATPCTVLDPGPCAAP